MPTTPFSTVVASSEVADRFSEAMLVARQKMTQARQDRLRDVQKKVEELKQRGLLKRQEYSISTRADFRRIFSKSEHS